MTDSQQDGPARLSTGSQPPQPGAGSDGLLAVAANLSQYHREHLAEGNSGRMPGRWTCRRMRL